RRSPSATSRKSASPTYPPQPKKMAGSSRPLPAILQGVVRSAAGGSADRDQRRHRGNGRVDRAEHVVDVGAKLGDADDTDHGDQADEQPVFDHRRTLIVPPKTSKLLKHGVPSSLQFSIYNDRSGIARPVA